MADTAIPAQNAPETLDESLKASLIKPSRGPMKILICSSELEPFAKTGGLADVTAALCKRLARAGHEVKLFLPKFKSVYQTGVRGKMSSDSLEIAFNGSSLPLRWEIYRDKANGFEVVFVVNDDLFHRESMYQDPQTGLDYQDNDTRFFFFCRAALEIAKSLDWRPDIIHANDWQSALVVSLHKTCYADDPFFQNTRSLLTIHNAAYQGVFDKTSLAKLGDWAANQETARAMTHRGKMNFLKSAIHYADIVNTVSERYAVEIQSSPEYGFGLEGALRQRNADLFGALNGVDYEIWDPAVDTLIPYQYSVNDISGKSKNKLSLQRELKLTEDTRPPMIGMISRLTEQKGIDLFLEIAEDILSLDVQMVALGEGGREYVASLRELEKQFPNNFRALIGFDNRMAHTIEAASDMYLMPSRYEPCGLNQLYSLRYGTAPIVRETGGLADTISEYDPATGEGIGFVFKNYSSDELLEAMCRG
ncbi:MAG: glycogen synthase [candidate division Zixibacteria bacterium]|nr:glycogen synthase [candidate division Zixibacteria bacterium]